MISWVMLVLQTATNSVEVVRRQGVKEPTESGDEGWVSANTPEIPMTHS
jgi:hypothetical protein